MNNAEEVLRHAGIGHQNFRGNFRAVLDKAMWAEGQAKFRAEEELLEMFDLIHDEWFELKYGDLLEAENND